jgi:hypothetical protein
MAETAKRKLVVIEDTTILNMARNEKFLGEFPFLTSLGAIAKKKVGGCGQCGSGNRERGQALNAAKATIAGMSAEKKKRLMQLLNAEKIRVVFNDGARTLSKTIEGG